MTEYHIKHYSKAPSCIHLISFSVLSGSESVFRHQGSKASDLVPLSVIDDARHADGGVAAAQIVAQVSHSLLQLDGGEVSVVDSGHVEHQPRVCLCTYVELNDQPEEQIHMHEDDDDNDDKDDENRHSPVLHLSVVKLKGHVTVSGQTELFGQFQHNRFRLCCARHLCDRTERTSIKQYILQNQHSSTFYSIQEQSTQ